MRESSFAARTAAPPWCCRGRGLRIVDRFAATRRSAVAGEPGHRACGKVRGRCHDDPGSARRWRRPRRWRFSWRWFPWWRLSRRWISRRRLPQLPRWRLPRRAGVPWRLSLWRLPSPLRRVPPLLWRRLPLRYRRHFHHRRYFYGSSYYYPAYYRHRRCRVVWTYYGPRRICRPYWHHRHYWRPYGVYW